MYSIQLYSRNIKACLDNAPKECIKDGVRWYKEANELAKTLAEKYDLSVYQAAGIIAAYSINASWSNNKNYVRQFLEGDFKGLKQAYDKASAILTAETAEDIADILRGPKITAFYMNIAGHTEFVTVDRHAARVAGMTDSLTPKRMRELQAAYILVAEDTKYSPAQVQAITWCAYREEHVNLKLHGKNI